MAKAFVAVRTLTDVLFSVNILLQVFLLCFHLLCKETYWLSLMLLLSYLLQFRLAYVAPESTVVGAGQLVDHPRKIARHYFRGKFLLDLFIVMPLPQVL